MKSSLEIPIQNIQLARPLAIFDLESTGTSTTEDRIVEIGIVKLYPDHQHEHFAQRVNPGIPIPAEATAVHGITDADVADQPSFAQIADEVVQFLDGADLCGFNARRFDLPLLLCEFVRAKKTFPLRDRAIVDPMEIYHHYESRNLEAAVKFYCGREHTDSHAASSDAIATLHVLDAMLGRYADLPRDMSDLQRRFVDENCVDIGGRFVRNENCIYFNFGKYKGQRLMAVARQDADYLEWMLKQDFLDDAKSLVRKALEKIRLRAS